MRGAEGDAAAERRRFGPLILAAGRALRTVVALADNRRPPELHDKLMRPAAKSSVPGLGTFGPWLPSGGCAPDCGAL